MTGKFYIIYEDYQIQSTNEFQALDIPSPILPKKPPMAFPIDLNTPGSSGLTPRILIASSLLQPVDCISASILFSSAS